MIICEVHPYGVVLRAFGWPWRDFVVISKRCIHDVVLFVVRHFPEVIVDRKDYWKLFIMMASKMFMRSAKESLSIPESRALR